MVFREGGDDSRTIQRAIYEFLRYACVSDQQLQPWPSNLGVRCCWFMLGMASHVVVNFN
ncbi:hypothetical protein Syun_022192 [Stephania yunnanensis]|uniref:Uncharacterized protein n=1 Tax=Stephania yunnanensis TaxID=152371 RepID=A0AAP0IHS5_9MAGN